MKSSRKNIAVLGSTGTIGRGALDIVRAFPKDFNIVGISANTNTTLLNEQVKEFSPNVIGVGEKDLLKVATIKEVDLVVVAVVGLSGLLPTLAAIRKGKNVAIATKEVLVVAGELIMKEAKKYNVSIIPIDSEHSALFQCLRSGEKKEVKKLVITMGKGPIASMSKEELSKVTIEQIRNRPMWEMGNKITIDSATCINKSFEVIEARWLFDISPKKITIVVHPEYICHSMVEFVDGSTISEMGSADMKRYIQFALFYPKRRSTRITHSISIINKTLTFEDAPYDKFPGLSLGFNAIKKGGTMPAVMHGSDDAAVEAFLSKKISFIDIPKIIHKAMNAHNVVYNPTLSQIISADKWGNEYTKNLINHIV